MYMCVKFLSEGLNSNHFLSFLIKTYTCRVIITLMMKNDIKFKYSNALTNKTKIVTSFLTISKFNLI